MKKIKLSPDEAKAYHQADAARAAAAFEFNQLCVDLLKEHGVQSPFQIHGDVLVATPKEATS